MRFTKERRRESIFATSPLGIFLETIQLDQTVALFPAIRASWRREHRKCKRQKVRRRTLKCRLLGMPQPVSEDLTVCDLQ